MGKITEQELANKLKTDILNYGNYSTTYQYDENGKIEGATITGDKNETCTYTYFTSGENLGKIESETIVRNGKTIVNTFAYTNGKITGISTITTGGD